MKLYEIAVVLLCWAVWAAIATALEFSPIAAFIGGLVAGWGVTRYFGR